MPVGDDRRSGGRSRPRSARCPPTDGPLRARYEGNGIPVTILSKGGTAGSSVGYLQDALAHLISTIRPDVVYASTLQMFSAIDAARALGCPSIWNIRESEEPESYFGRIAGSQIQLALDCFSFPYRVLFDSYACQRLFEGLNVQRNFAVIHTGLPRGDWSRQLAQRPRGPRPWRSWIESRGCRLPRCGHGLGTRKGQLDPSKRSRGRSNDAVTFAA